MNYLQYLPSVAWPLCVLRWADLLPEAEAHGGGQTLFMFVPNISQQLFYITIFFCCSIERI